MKNVGQTATWIATKVRELSGVDEITPAAIERVIKELYRHEAIINRDAQAYPYFRGIYSQITPESVHSNESERFKLKIGILFFDVKIKEHYVEKESLNRIYSVEVEAL
jgi:hypothetical protein